MSATDDILTAHLAELDDDVLIAINDSASAQAQYLSQSTGTEARTMAVICGVIAAAAEVALLRRSTGAKV